MNERIRPTRSGLFAIELLIAVGIFTLCAAICVGLFVRAEVLSRESEELTHAVNTARNIAENFKASEGELEKTARLLEGEGALSATLTRDKEESGIMLSLKDDEGLLYELTPDGAFMLAEGGEAADAAVSAAGSEGGGVLYARLSAFNGEGEELLSWRVAALSGDSGEVAP